MPIELKTSRPSSGGIELRNAYTPQTIPPVTLTLAPLDHAGSVAALDLRITYAVQATIEREPGVYGPAQDPNGVFWGFRTSPPAAYAQGATFEVRAPAVSDGVDVVGLPGGSIRATNNSGTEGDKQRFIDWSDPSGVPQTPIEFYVRVGPAPVIQLAEMAHSTDLASAPVTTAEPIFPAELLHAHSIENAQPAASTPLAVLELQHATLIDAPAVAISNPAVILAELLHATVTDRSNVLVNAVLIPADVLIPHTLEAAVQLDLGVAPIELLHSYTLEAGGVVYGPGVRSLSHAHTIDPAGDFNYRIALIPPGFRLVATTLNRG